MKSIKIIVLFISLISVSAWADGVSFATSEDLAAFDKAVSKKKRTSRKSLRRSKVQIEQEISTLVKDEERTQRRKNKSSSGNNSSSAGNSSASPGNSGSAPGQLKNKGKKK